MNIKTITCHDVYNLGASLQAYALATYLCGQGHHVQIIDYKPEYLSRHYSLGWVANPRFDHPILRQAYLMAKLPQRLRARASLRKQRFDSFREDYLPLTDQRYSSGNDLQERCPEADVFIAGSDQIWNPLFPNGKDPAFFLAFVPSEKKKLSYAASFAVDTLSPADQARMQPWLNRLDAISVRETSGAKLLNDMGLKGVPVMDPVFLLDREQWEHLAVYPKKKGYILVYDFDQSPRVWEIAKQLAARSGKSIVSVFPMEGAAEVWSDLGPREFLGAIQNASYVLSNSFHATAFSLIFQRDFYVVDRQENINARMRDLLATVALEHRRISALPEEIDALNWCGIQAHLDEQISHSKKFLDENLHN